MVYSLVAEHGFLRNCKLSSCGSWALSTGLVVVLLGLQLLVHGYGMWNLPGPGVEPMFPGLAGGFLATKLPRKSYLSA